MSPRRRAKPTRDNDTQASQDQRAPYVSIFGSPKAAPSVPTKPKSTPNKRSASGSTSERSSPEPRKKVVRLMPGSQPSVPPTTQRPTTGLIASPQSVARVFDFQGYQRLLEASPMAAACTPQTQSRLPPSTDARKAPRKGTTTPARAPSRVMKPQIRTSEIKKHQRANPVKPSTLVPMFKSEDEFQEAVAADLKLPRQKAAAAASALTSRASTISQLQGSLRPLPRFEYAITPQLKNIQKAFGEDNWTAYIIEIEKHEFGEIDDAELEKQERRIFQTPSVPGSRRMIKELVLERMLAAEGLEQLM